LPNAYRVHEKVISGGLPEGEAAFQELAALGVKTIVSVDGARPDVALAKAQGMRYVHLPHGYDGIPNQRMLDLAKAVRDLPGQVYIHCHHGKHRSPTAAAVACVAAGLIDADSAEAILKAAGTSESYRGLYQSARQARLVQNSVLDGAASDFPETAAIPPLAEAMVAVEHTHDHLKQIAEAGWKSPPKHPDLEPAHEALLLHEHFKELQRLDSVTRMPEAFQRYLRTSERAAEDLERALREGAPSETATVALTRINAACIDCHRQYRDVPLSDKR
jgi:protein tyrosine phosphatase (PTP) superfamily phosphohydrolase (DUF442 family)